MKIEYKSEAEIRVEENLIHDASFDSVTGVFNRHHFLKLAHMEMSYSSRYKVPIGAVLIDIDNFKQVNDSYGHQCGDFVLAQFADIIIRNKRTEDLLGRYGGDEFIILPRGEINKADMRATCERIRNAIKDAEFHFDGNCIRITASIGFHLMQPDDKDVEGFLDKIIQTADKALYRAKDSGRDQTVDLL